MTLKHDINNGCGADDYVGLVLRKLTIAWSRVFGDEPVTTRDAIQKGEEHCDTDHEWDLVSAIQAVSCLKGGGYSSRKLGMWIRRQAGRRVKFNSPTGRGGVQGYFKRVGERDRMALWVVVVETTENRQPRV